MIDFENIRELREKHHLTQEQMAEKLAITRNGYAKIEQGKSMPNLKRLNEIANIFGVELFDLLKMDNQNIVYQIGENYHGNNNYYNGNEKLEKEIIQLKSEIQKLQLIIAHKDELLEQKDDYIKVLKQIVNSATPILETL